MLDQLPSVIRVRADWDAEAAVWVAESPDIPGLATEADTIEALRAKLPGMIADLIEANGLLSDQSEIPISIVANAVARVSPT